MVVLKHWIDNTKASVTKEDRSMFWQLLWFEFFSWSCANSTVERDCVPALSFRKITFRGTFCKKSSHVTGWANLSYTWVRLLNRLRSKISSTYGITYTPRHRPGDPGRHSVILPSARISHGDKKWACSRGIMTEASRKCKNLGESSFREEAGSVVR